MTASKQAPSQADQGAFALLKSHLAGHEVDWPKDELLDVLHWLKMAIALGAGVTFGYLPVVGWHGFSLYLILYFALMFVALRMLKVDDEMYGGTGDFINDNLGVALGFYLLVWTLTFNAMGYS